MPRVTAILVVQDGERWLDGTLAALAAQSRRPDALVVVAEPTTDLDGELLATAGVTQVVTATGGTFGVGIARALRAAPPAEGEDELLWLLRADTAPQPQALRELLAAVELAPSLAVAGPKLVDADTPDRIRSYGETMSRLGTTVALVDDELDQAQYDPVVDVMSVAVEGSLVRRSVWQAVDGLDAGLPSTDAGLDLGVRVRLAGHRVVRVPSARVARARRPEDVGRRRPAAPRTRRRLARTAQLHRRFVYAPGILVPVHWLSLLPLAVIRCLGQLLAKRPGAVPGEIAAAFVAAFDGSVPGARSRLRRARRTGWRAVAPLRLEGAPLREHRAHERDRDDERQGREPDLVRASFLGGGSWVLVAAVAVGAVLSWRLFGATALEGGALLPLSSGVAELWSRLGWGAREIGVGFLGAADPATGIWALLGSATWWDPSFSIVVLWLTALPFAALGAWWAATRLSERTWPPVVAALLWMLAPPLLAALNEGRAGAVVAHLLLPWLALALLEGARSWSAAAAASLLFAAVTAAAPVLAPALLVGVVAWAFARPRGFVRLIGVPIPAAVLFAPLVIGAVRRGSPLAVLADPGPVQPFTAPSGWGLVIGRPDQDAAGWDALLASFGLDGAPWGTLAPAVLLAPLGVLAVLALFLPGARRSIPALAVATAGLATAWLAVHLEVTTSGAATVGPWPGAALSLYWLGLLGAAVVALEVLGRGAAAAGSAVVVTSALAVVPAILAAVLGTAPVHAGDGRILPALAAAAARTDPGIGTLVLTPEEDGSLTARLERGEGAMLDDQSALHAGRTEASDDELALAELAGNLASRGGYDPAPELQRFQLGFVLVAPLAEDAGEDAVEVRERAVESLDARAELTPESDSGYGTLWAYPALERTTDTAPARGAYGVGVLAVQGAVILFALLLALPTRRRRRVVQTRTPLEEAAATTFDEDSDD
ncbi:glycosyltransferase family 2 protein [Protaetiibacter intestinalis]|uniref:Glycosyltransferase family 2 protein n=1 Tax=Protaetiibacter intestinalis TaxID=2419774 RepID=A0A387B7N8_9MICO|nr:glycosyltransferase [Protaetiibacter intestinalis]AYF98367.1 glycosyltransferase family 2 protein [Protaetiibacter intestinalis]